jgi:hypothetical protein
MVAMVVASVGIALVVTDAAEAAMCSTISTVQTGNFANMPPTGSKTVGTVTFTVTVTPDWSGAAVASIG